MSQLLGYAIPGIPFGCTYAIVAVGLVLTYQATGVFNFAFGAQAYVAAFAFFDLTRNVGLPVWLAFVLSVVVLSPLLGLIFDRFLFRVIPNTNTTAKVVTGIALFVGFPDLLTVLFGSTPQYNAPSILLNPDVVYFNVGSTPVNGLDLATVIVTAAVLIVVTVLMRGTNLGLQMRGAVESRRLVQLDGINAGAVVSFSWAISSLLAGLAGVLLAPLNAQLLANNYATLMVAAIAASAWAVLRSLPIAAGVGILIGVVEGIAQGYLPTGGILYASVLPSLPFIVLVLALLFVPGMRTLGVATDPMGGVDPPLPPTVAQMRHPTMNRIIQVAFWVLVVVYVISSLTWVPTNWVYVFTEGMTLSVIFLSITVVTGLGGQLSLCQASFAGIGAFTAAQLAAHLHMSLLLGALVGSAIAAGVAVILAVASLRLGGLGLSLLTLAIALFFDNTIFPLNSVSDGQTGINMNSPKIGPIGFGSQTSRPFFVLAFVILILFTVIVLLLRRGTIGRFLSAMRGSQVGASGLGINLTSIKIIAFAFSAVLAACGGVLYGSLTGNVGAIDFNYEYSLIYIVVVVTTGVSTVEGAIQAGMGYVIITQLLTYLPGRIGGGSLTAVLFAFGALTYAKHPEGALEFSKARSTARFERLIFKTDMNERGLLRGTV